MTWQTPKTDWATDDGIGTDDLNRIEGNIADLRGSQGTNLTAANNMALPVTGDHFFVDGTTDIQTMQTNGRTAGTRVWLTFNGAVTVKTNAGSPPAGYAKFRLYDANPSAPYYTERDQGPNTNLTWCFIYDGSVWRIAGGAI